MRLGERDLRQDDGLRRLTEDASYAPRRWVADIIKAYRKKIQVLRADTDEQNLYAIRPLRLEQLKGKRAGTSCIRLNDQFRLIIKFETDEEGRMVIIIEMAD
ncbi:type II toxin-antitoxin system RelE/ParE family toxin [Corynebacterium flavescens]|uniref:type II toxin-antitoxin system RelE/ParE family toxin n=1 Tax=Corynebacterium flavescens TaxID=28028 RepID=UPI000ECB2DB6|nr:plasmid maintenance system killer protein [Corynebacterium flavescens]